MHGTEARILCQESLRAKLRRSGDAKDHGRTKFGTPRGNERDDDYRILGINGHLEGMTNLPNNIDIC